MSATETAYRWILAWTVLLVILWGLSKTSIGYIALYYILVLSILFVVLTQYTSITSALKPFSTLADNQVTQAGGK